MKKIVFVLCLLFPMFIVAQTIQVDLKSGKSFIGRLKNIGTKNNNLIFWDKVVGTDVNYVDVSDISAIMGALYNSQKKTILKKNPRIIFYSGNLTKRDYKQQNIVVLSNKNNSSQQQSQQGTVTHYQPTSGDLMQLAGKRYLAGVSVGLGGGVLAAIGSYKGNTTLTYIGGGTAVIGVIISITGHFKLIEAGKAMNREAVTLSASDNGIGLAINF